MKLGVDLSILDELEEYHPSYFYQGQKIEPFSFFSTHSGIKTVRLRLWVNPYDENHSPYGGGTNDLNATIKLAKKAKENGMNILLDFHYSDFYVDPSRQRVPKDWTNLSYKGIQKRLEEYTIEVLSILKKEKIDVMGVQVGNEITNGMLFPFGQLDKEFDPINGGGFKGLGRLLNIGYKSVKSVYPNAKVIIHLEHSGSNDIQDWYLSNLNKHHVKYDVVGESYYPYWHGPISNLVYNINKLKKKFHKEIWLVEVGYEWGESLLLNHHNDFIDQKDDEEFNVGNINGRIPYPITQEGQKDYFIYLLSICKKLDIGYLFYWEPCWTLQENNGWAKEAGQRYCGLTPTKAENDWANETLFDFKGNATKAIDVFTQDFVDNLK